MNTQSTSPQPIEALAEAIRDADQAAIRAMQEAAHQLDRSRHLAERLTELQRNQEN